MIIGFELSMPSNNSWNGKWSGDEKLFAIVKTLKNPPKLGAYYYDFGDGWAAKVTVRELTSSAAAKMRKQTAGFAGYDWMVDSIIDHGEIKTS